ncbi:MAG: hypothetical protein F6J87_13710 [Spirulina sp. SIO3F2]|nr:hypothetical protein [Spirulina sp. SIO3F2]
MNQQEQRPFHHSGFAYSPQMSRLLWVLGLAWMGLMLWLLGLIWQLQAPKLMLLWVWGGLITTSAIVVILMLRQYQQEHHRLRQLIHISHQMLEIADPTQESLQLSGKALPDLSMLLLTLQSAQTKQQKHLKTCKDALSDTLLALQGDHLQRIQAEKMTSLNQMAAGLAHEVNNPVNFISGNLPLAQRYIQDLLLLIVLYQQEAPYPSERLQAHLDEIELEFIQADLPKLLSSIGSGAQRIQSIVGSLRTFACLDEAQLKVVDIHMGLESTLVFLQHQLKAAGLNQTAIVLEKQYGDLPSVECYASQLNQVFLNLLTNAIDAIDLRRTTHLVNYQPKITLQTEVLATAQSVAVTITDNGSGIPEAVQDRLFDPFFTTKPVGQGTGLGLAMSYQIIVKQHNGSITCTSTLGRGSQFQIQIPIRQAKPSLRLPRDRSVSS